MILTLDQLMAKSIDKINTLAEPVRSMAIALVHLSYARGIMIVITEANRTYQYQDYLYSKGRTLMYENGKKLKIVTNARGGYSNHNFAHAFDFALLLPNGKTVSWDDSRSDNLDSLPDWDEVVIEGKRLGLEWGGDWRSFTDLPHFQWVAGLTTAQFRSGLRPPKAAVSAAMEVVAKTMLVKPQPKPEEETYSVAFTYYNGAQKLHEAFQVGKGASPIMYVQARDLATTLGVVAEWRNDEKKLYFNGRALSDVKLIDGRTYIQLRPIAESYKKTVVYDKAAKKTGVA